MPQTRKGLRPWVMPDSAYDADANPAYFAVRQTTIEFHSMLKSRTEINRRDNSILDLNHFDKAIKEVIRIVSRRYRSKLDIFLDVLAELLLVVAGIIITPLIIEFINWLNQLSRSTSFQPASTSILGAIIGIILISFKLFLNYR